MKSIWKWILGIILVLVVVSLFVSMAYLMYGGGFSRQIGIGNIKEFGQFYRGPMMGQGQLYGFGGGPGHMMGRIGFISPFMFICRSFSRLVPLALLALLVYGAYRLGTRNSNLQVKTNTVPSSPVMAEASTSSIKSCRKCGGEVQEGWNNCPMCGTKQ